MPKSKYYYDKHSLKFEKIELTKNYIIKKFLIFSFFIILSGLLFYLITFYFIDSPKEKLLKSEIENMQYYYEQLSKKIDRISKITEDIKERDNNIYRLYFEVDKIPDEIRKSGLGGINRYKKLEGYNNSELIKEVYRKTDLLYKEVYVQSKSFDDIIKLAKNKKKMIASIPAIQPILNKELKFISSGYGYRMDPIYKIRKMHWGIDFAAPKNTPIYCTGDGVIKKVSRSFSLKRGYGNAILIDHGFSYQTFYAHLNKSIVKPNQKVKRGQIIGYVGSTGKSTAYHLHYEVIYKKRKVNPIFYFYSDLTPEEQEKAFIIASQENQSLD